MRFKAILPTLLLLSTLLGCKKEETPVDPRDKFVGSYRGTVNVKIPSLSIDETEQATVSIAKSTSSTSQIIIDGTNRATVNGNSYTYIEFTESENIPNFGTVVWIFNGTGTLNGTNLSESGTVRTVIQGVTYSGTWSTNLVKQ